MPRQRELLQRAGSCQPVCQAAQRHARCAGKPAAARRGERPASGSGRARLPRGGASSAGSTARRRCSGTCAVAGGWGRGVGPWFARGEQGREPHAGAAPVLQHCHQHNSKPEHGGNGELHVTHIRPKGTSGGGPSHLHLCPGRRRRRRSGTPLPAHQRRGLHPVLKRQQREDVRQQGVGQVGTAATGVGGSWQRRRGESGGGGAEACCRGHSRSSDEP